MNGAKAYISRRGGYCLKLPVLSLFALFLLLVSGCITSSPEDDYVAEVLAEAMQGSGDLQEVTVQSVDWPLKTSAPAPVSIAQPPPISIPQPPPVSIVQPTSVSVAPAAAVSVAPATTVSVPVKSVVQEPKAVEAVPRAEPVPPSENPPPSTVSLPPATLVSVPTSSPQSEVRSSDSAVSVSPSVDPQLGPTQRSVRPQPAIPTIQPDSVLWVSVAEDPSLNGRYMVNDASAIDFGYVGLVFLPDMSVEQAESELKRVLEGRYLKNATVSVKLAKASYDRVGVQGSVEMPGDIKIGPGATIPLSEALRRASGIRGNRENSRVKIVRGGLKTPFGPAAEGDVYSLVTQDGQLKVPDVFLRNDDLVYVFTPSSDVAQGQVGGSGSTGAGGKRVVLLGEVPRRGVVEFAESEPCTLMYLLFKVGGLPRFARADKITVVRRSKDGTEKKFLIDGEKLLNYGKPEDDLVLETGDRIVVPARKISFF